MPPPRNGSGSNGSGRDSTNPNATDTRNRDEDTFTVADDESLADVIVEFERASQRSRVIAAQHNLNDTKYHPRAGTVSLRWIYLLVIDDFARHAGHSDILVEQINDMQQQASSRRRSQRK